MRNAVKRIFAPLFLAAVLTACGSAGTSAENFDLAGADLSKLVTLGDYKNLAVTVTEKTAVTDEAVQSEYDAKVSEVQNEGEQITEGTVKDGDTVNIDFEGKKDGVAFDGGTAQGYQLVIGSGSFIPGFESGLIGVNVGETVDLNLTFPEDYGSAELAGQDVVFTVTVNSIVNTISEVTDAQAGQIAEGASTLEEAKSKLREKMEADAEKSYQELLSNTIQSELVNVSQFKKVPEGFAKDCADLLMNEYTRIAESYGMSVQAYAANVYNLDTATFNARVQEWGEDAAKQAIAYQALANAEGITVSDADVQAQLSAVRDENEYSGGLVDLLKYSGDAANVRTGLMMEKVNEYLKGVAKITNEPVNTEPAAEETPAEEAPAE